jgi:hypothetical protein
MKILGSIFLALAVLVGCAHPVDHEEDTAEAVGAFTLHNDPTALKAAITGGASYDLEAECLVIDEERQCLALVDGVFSIVADDAPGALKIKSVVYDHFFVGSLIVDAGPPVGEYHNVLHVPADAYMPVRGLWTESETWRTLVAGEGDDAAYAVLGSP